MKYLLLLIPSLSFANYVSETGSVTYWSKSDCEKIEAKECFAKPLDADTKKLADVEVDDTSKPIIEETDAELVRNPDNGLDEPRCEAPKELDVEANKCREVKGYEKKLEKQFVVDQVKVKAIEDKKKAIEQKQTLCNEFKTLLADSAIDGSSKAADVQEVARRLLGYLKACSGI